MSPTGRKWAKVIAAFLAGVFVPLALVLSVIIVAGMVKMAHPVHVTGTVISGGCYTEDDDSGGTTQCDVAVSFTAPDGIAGVVSFAHVAAKSINEQTAAGTQHPSSSDQLGNSAAGGIAATVPVYFDRASSTTPISPRNVNQPWVYLVGLAFVWFCAGLFGIWMPWGLLRRARIPDSSNAGISMV